MIRNSPSLLFLFLLFSLSLCCELETLLTIAITRKTERAHSFVPTFCVFTFDLSAARSAECDSIIA